jgi:hypothetical protein
MQPIYLHDDADAYSVDRSLEAYLLWLFGYIMFNNTHGNTVDKILLPYARAIADADEDDVPTWSWGSAVLAATYRGLCDGCMKTKEGAILTGCPLLLQLWSYERIAIARPIIDLSPYDQGMYGALDDDRPTMGTIWLIREVCVQPCLFSQYMHVRL